MDNSAENTVIEIETGRREFGGYGWRLEGTAFRFSYFDVGFPSAKEAERDADRFLDRYFDEQCFFHEELFELLSGENGDYLAEEEDGWRMVFGVDAILVEVFFVSKKEIPAFDHAAVYHRIWKEKIARVHGVL